MSQQGPQDWLTYVLGLSSVQVNGQPVPGSPGERIVNIVGAGVTGTDNPGNGSTDVAIPSATPAVPGQILVTGPVTVAATPGAWHLCDVSAGPVVLTSPTGAGVVAQTWFGAKIIKGPVGAVNKLTVTAAGGSTIEEPIEQSAPNTGVQGASAIYQQAGDLGTAAKWAYDGTSKWWRQ